MTFSMYQGCFDINLNALYKYADSDCKTLTQLHNINILKLCKFGLLVYFNGI